MLAPLSASSTAFTNRSHASTIAVVWAAVNSLAGDSTLTNDFTSWLSAFEPAPVGAGVFWAVAGAGIAGRSGADKTFTLADNLRCNHRGGAVFGNLIDGIILDFLQGPAISQGYDVIFIGHGS